VNQINRSIWSLGDQGVVSAGNFFTTLLLARSLSSTEYGVFVLLFGVILTLNTVHAAVITYPLSIEGAVADLGDLRKLTSSCLFLTVCLTLPFALVITTATIALNRSDVLPIVVLATGSWQLQETLRRGLMAHLRHKDALLGDIFMYGGQVGVILALSIAKTLTVQRAFISITCSCLCGALVHYVVLRPQANPLIGMRRTAKRFWLLGKWALYANSANSLTIQSFFWIVARSGSSQAGTLQALVNLLAFTNPVAFSIGNVVVPAVAQSRAQRAESGLKVLLQFVLQGLVLLFPYYLVILAAPGWALRTAYGAGSMYISFAGSLRLLVFAFGMAYIAHLGGCFLYGAADSMGVFRTQLMSSSAAAIIGFPLTIKFGVVGAVIAILITHGVRLVALCQRVVSGLRKRIYAKSEMLPGISTDPLSEVDFA